MALEYKDKTGAPVSFDKFVEHISEEQINQLTTEELERARTLLTQMINFKKTLIGYQDNTINNATRDLGREPIRVNGQITDPGEGLLAQYLESHDRIQAERIRIRNAQNGKAGLTILLNEYQAKLQLIERRLGIPAQVAPAQPVPAPTLIQKPSTVQPETTDSTPEEKAKVQELIQAINGRLGGQNISDVKKRLEESLQNGEISQEDEQLVKDIKQIINTRGRGILQQVEWYTTHRDLFARFLEDIETRIRQGTLKIITPTVQTPQPPTPPVEQNKPERRWFGGFFSGWGKKKAPEQSSVPQPGVERRDAPQAGAESLRPEDIKIETDDEIVADLIREIQGIRQKLEEKLPSIAQELKDEQRIAGVNGADLATKKKELAQAEAEIKKTSGEEQVRAIANRDNLRSWVNTYEQVLNRANQTIQNIQEQLSSIQRHLDGTGGDIFTNIPNDITIADHEKQLRDTRQRLVDYRRQQDERRVKEQQERETSRIQTEENNRIGKLPEMQIKEIEGLLKQLETEFNNYHSTSKKRNEVPQTIVNLILKHRQTIFSQSGEETPTTKLITDYIMSSQSRDSFIRQIKQIIPPPDNSTIEQEIQRYLVIYPNELNKINAEWYRIANLIKDTVLNSSLLGGNQKSNVSGYLKPYLIETNIPDTTRSSTREGILRIIAGNLY